MTLPCAAKTYYVDASTGSDSNTGLKESAAFATIQKAIDKAAAGSTILVYPGVYEAIKTNNKKLTIKAVDGGADQTSIKPSEIGTDVVNEEYWDEENGEWVYESYETTVYSPIVADLGSWGTQAEVCTVENQMIFSDGTKISYWYDWRATEKDNWDYWKKNSRVVADFLSAHPNLVWDEDDGAYYDEDKEEYTYLSNLFGYWDEEAEEWVDSCWYEPSSRIYSVSPKKPKGWTLYDPPAGVTWERGWDWFGYEGWQEHGSAGVHPFWRQPGCMGRNAPELLNLRVLCTPAGGPWVGGGSQRDCL